ncbi:MAG: DEAD/DEAH box helicase [Bacteriovoracaceae bacterium]|nr:DEAD/DEAH box helicase [Bacteriovoracaceae bacterium]
MSHPLGKWAVIDIETTGADAAHDEVIDLGFLEFEGTTLVRKYSSLVKFDGKLSKFIQKLTGITPKMLKGAPQWREVEPELQSLLGHNLLAHNADFEHSFLSRFFEDISEGNDREQYQDSMYYLALLFPQFSTLKLEKFIIDLRISDTEVHRGFEDSLDLLKVILVATLMVRRDREYYNHLNAIFEKYDLESFWYHQFFKLEVEDLYHIADQIDFDIEGTLTKALDGLSEVSSKENYDTKDFDLGFSGGNISAILKDEDKVTKHLPFYSFRQSQLELSLKVGQCLKNEVHALVQAPTGTGKTLGYLLPAALFALNEKKQVLIATGTKTLQEQAMSKDVPQLRKLLGLGKEKLKITRMIGSSNHMCELLYRQNVNDGTFMSKALPFNEAFTEIYFEMAFFYNSRMPYDKKIVRDELPFVMKMKNRDFGELEKNIAVDFRSCTGFKCPYRDVCSYMNGINEAKESDLIIGNHALMFSWPRAFPRPGHIIVDEAHKIEGEATNAFSLEVTNDSLLGLGKSLRNSQGLGSLYYLLENDDDCGNSKDLVKELKDEAHLTFTSMHDHLLALPDIIEKYFKRRPYYTDTFWNESPMVYDVETDDALALSIFNSFSSIKNILELLEQVLTPYYSRWDIKNIKDDNQIVALTRFHTFFDQLEDTRNALDVLLTRKEGHSHALKFHEKYGFATYSGPIDVGRVLHDGLLETSQSVVFTSATLGNAKGDQGTRGVEWATGYLYLDPKKRFKSGSFLPAVYDYTNKAKVFLCDDTPPLFRPEFVPEVLGPIMGLIENIGGKTLLLFSARARFETAREILLERFDGKIPLFIQGMGSNVIDEFKEKGGILLGMESFGEGIDIPGETLQFVFVDKIPDLRRELVIDDRRDYYEKNIGNEFTDYFLSHRTRSLHQKLGRLLRTTSDSGGVIVVDSRIKKWKGATMGKMIKLMEPYNMERTNLKDAVEQVEQFIND